MALPPTRLTQLLGAASQEPAALIRALVNEGCVSGPTAKDPELTQLLANTVAAAQARPPHPGPTQADMLAQALMNSRFLTPRGRRYASSENDTIREVEVGRKFLFGLLGFSAVLQGWSVLHGTSVRSRPAWLGGLFLLFGVALLFATGASFLRSRLQILLFRMSAVLGLAFSFGIAFTRKPQMGTVFSTLFGIFLGVAILIWLWREAARAEQEFSPD